MPNSLWCAWSHISSISAQWPCEEVPVPQLKIIDFGARKELLNPGSGLLLQFLLPFCYLLLSHSCIFRSIEAVHLFITLFIVMVYEYLSVCVVCTCACLVPDKGMRFIALESQMVMSHCMSPGNGTHGS